MEKMKIGTRTIGRTASAQSTTLPSTPRSNADSRQVSRRLYFDAPIVEMLPPVTRSTAPVHSQQYKRTIHSPVPGPSEIHVEPPSGLYM